MVIAHRLSTIRNADKIVVMEKGELAEEGDHETLMKKGEKYFSLVEQQNLRRAEEEQEMELKENEDDPIIKKNTLEPNARFTRPRSSTVASLTPSIKIALGKYTNKVANGDANDTDSDDRKKAKEVKNI